MKKLLLSLTLVLCLVASMVALTSCGGGEEGCEHIWATVSTPDTAATCTEEGSQSIKCLECGEKKADSITAIPALGHAYDDGTTIPATCLEDGSVTKTCAVCGDVNVTTIPTAGEHTWSADAIVDTYPTCTTDGSKSIKCTACQITKPDTTVVIPAGHTWAETTSIVTPASCTTDGVKAIRCTVCREVKPETNEVIPATGHTDIDVVIAPTLFTEGRIKGTCSTCGVNVNETIPKADTTTVVTFSPDGENVGIYKNVNIVNDVLKGDHFYPTEENPDGKGLYIEFSVLWNETLLDVHNGKARYAQLGTLGDMNGTSDGKRITPYFLVFNQTADKEKFWCQYPGGFETDNNTTNIYGPKVESGLPADGYTYIGEYGWHRIGIEYTQVTEIEGETVKYTLYATLYIDGVKVLAYQAIKTTTDNNPNLLYTATVINGNVEYEDIASDRYAFIYRFGNDQKTETEDNAYFVVGDISVTAGNGFVKNVTKLDTPVEGTYVPAEGVELDADQYFAYDKTANEMLYDEILESVEYPIDNVQLADGTIDYSAISGGNKPHKYQADDNKRVAFINVKNIAFNTVNIGVADCSSVRYTFVSKMPSEFGEVISYAIDYRTFVYATDDVTVSIPANAAYLVLYCKDNDVNSYMPESLTFTNDPNALSEQLKDNTLESFSYPVTALKPSQGTIADANLQYIPNFDWVTTYVDIRDCAFERITLEVNGFTGNISFGFLTAFPDIYDFPEFAEYGAAMATYSEQPVGTTFTVDIPAEAKVLVIYYQDKGPVYYLPKSITFINTDRDEPTEDGTTEDPVTVNGYSYPMESITPAGGFIDHSSRTDSVAHKYKTTDGDRFAFIDLAGIDYDTVTVISGAETAFVGFLSKLPTANGETVNYAINYSDIIEVNGTATFTVPENARYMAVAHTYRSGTVCLPEAIVFNDTETPYDMLKNDALTSYEYPMNTVKVSQGTIRSKDNVFISHFNWTCAFIYIDGTVFDKVTLEVNANKGCVGYGFLTEYPTIDSKVSYAGGANAMTFIEGKEAGDTITADIPADAKVLVIYWYDWDNTTSTPVHIKPESITFIKDGAEAPNPGDSEDAA